MSTEFSFKDYSPAPDDYIPPDDFDDEADDQAWREYCRIASTVDRQHVLDCVLSSLDAEDSPLFAFIDDALREPHEPGRPKDSITKLAQLGQAVLNRIARAVDDAVGLRMAIGGTRSR